MTFFLYASSARNTSQAGQSHTMLSTSGENTAKERVAFHLPQMDCPACVRHVEDTLRPVSGVCEVNVNLVERTVSVRGVALDGEALVRALTKAGYPPEAAHARQGDARPSPLWRTGRAYRTGLAGILWLVASALSFWGGDALWADLWHWRITLSAAVAILGAVLGATNFVPSAMRAARALNLNIDVLMTTAVVGALALGEFTEAAAICFLFSLAELLEARSFARGRDAIRELVELVPPTAMVIRMTGREMVPVAEISVAETVALRPGDRIPLDGVVTRGASDVNESALTGEAAPVRKSAGGEVFAGTLTLDGYIEVEVTRAAPDTVLAHVVQLVRSAHEKKARIEEFVHRFARVYTPAVVALAALLVVVPPLFLGEEWSVWVLRGLTLLVVACPCALVISTPVSFVSAITSGARHGVLVTGGEYLEALGTVRAIAFDKTGTITRGAPQVSGTDSSSGAPDEEVLRCAALLEAHSSHPVARAIVAEAARRNIASIGEDVTEVELIPGKGICGRIGGAAHRVVTAEGDVPTALANGRRDGKTLIQVEREGVLMGYIALSDAVRPEAREVVASLREMGVGRIVMLTGDNPNAARTVADSVGIADVRSKCLPADKLGVIEELRRNGDVVAMVGDGINDAPALAAATVGIAMGAAGSPTALEAADVALMSDDLRLLPYLIRLSRATRRVIRQNIWVSLGVKACMLAAVPLGLVSMTVAILVGDMGTSLAVTTNALRLVRVRP